MLKRTELKDGDKVFMITSGQIQLVMISTIVTEDNYTTVMILNPRGLSEETTFFSNNTRLFRTYDEANEYLEMINTDRMKRLGKKIVQLEEEISVRKKELKKYKSEFKDYVKW